MKNKGKLLLTLFLIIWAAFSVSLLVNHGYHYIGKSYFNSDHFQSNINAFKEQLGRYVLEPFDAEKAKEQIIVTQEEIDYHRNYYGTLTEQVENLRIQYGDRIAEAENMGDDKLKELLVKERDAKITDITENFQNDEHVEGKIRNEKEKLIDWYAEQEKRSQKDFLNEYSYFAYSLVNVDTGEKFELGQQQSSDLYTESFGSQEPYLMADSTAYIDDFDGTYTLPEGVRVEGKVLQFEGKISIPKAMLSKSNFQTDYQSYAVVKMIFYFIWITGILAIVALFTIAKPSSQLFLMTSNRVKGWFSKWPVDVKMIFVLIAGLIGFSIMDANGNMIRDSYYYSNNSLSFFVDFALYTVAMFVITSAAIIGAVGIWESINDEGKLMDELKGAMLYRLAGGMQDVFLNRSIGVQSIAILIVVFLAGIGFVGAALQGQLLLIYVPLFFFVALPSVFIFLRRMGYLNHLMKQTEEMAERGGTSEIIVKGKSPLARHAANLNQLREGVKQSMNEQAKSERLKTELITNVSHDLRTPLTSIITYTDLLKNPNITEEERQQYIDVLDKKSARLKTLIEDLFEVSKMASGNIELTKQRVDLTQLLQQAIGEHKEAFEKANLDLRVAMPESSLFAYVDGQKWWRVLDNLIVNALKYSLAGSRVYVTLKEQGRVAEFVIKNISNYELGENVEELTERFKRADASRHTDGSGLGLAIAQSIVDLHGGSLKVDLDGDLFKVIVTVQIDY